MGNEAIRHNFMENTTTEKTIIYGKKTTEQKTYGKQSTEKANNGWKAKQHRTKNHIWKARQQIKTTIYGKQDSREKMINGKRDNRTTQTYIYIYLWKSIQAKKYMESNTSQK